jgi:signal transduction histidine kinase
MNDEPRELNPEDWGFFGLRWVVLVIASLVYFLLHKDTGRTDITGNIFVTFFIGAMINIAFVVLAYYPKFRKAVPYAILIGDGILAGLYAGLGFFDDMYMRVGVSSMLMLTAALRLSATWSLVQVVIVTCIAIGELYLRQGADQVTLMMPTYLPPLTILVGMALLAAGLSYMHEKSGESQKQSVERFNRKAKSLVDSIRERNRVISDMAATLSAALLFRNDGALHVATSRGFTRNDFSTVVPGQGGILGRSLRECVPVFGKDGHRDPELQFFTAFQKSRSLLAIPLHANYDNFGVLIYGSEDPDAFNKEETDLLMAIGTQATIALHNAVLYRNLLDEKERIVEVEEDARKKLARDLHDGPTQNVSAIAMRMSYIYRLLERRPDEVPAELKKVEELARRTTKEIRDMLFTLRPLVLESQGLSAALEQLCQKTLETHGQHVVARVGPDVESVLDSHQQGVIFYIVEEAVGNARKHAEAELISVDVHRRNDVMVVEIADNGVGFDADAVNANYDQRGSLGMVNMRERAELLNGTLRIESAEGQGTKITIMFPLRDNLESSRLKKSKTNPNMRAVSRPRAPANSSQR